MQQIGQAYRQAMLEAPDLSFTPAKSSESGISAAASEAEARRREAQRLIEDLAKLRLSETQRIEAEYKRRKALIEEYTKDGSQAEKDAWADLDAWKAQQDSELAAKEKDAVQARYKAEIDYFSNLESLGVDSYDALKSAMEEYYTWAQDNLPEKERQLLSAQMNDVNVRHAKLLQERQEEEKTKLQEMQDIRDEFQARDLDNLGDSYNKQLMELDRYYERMKEKLLAAGLTGLYHLRCLYDCPATI